MAELIVKTVDICHQASAKGFTYITVFNLEIPLCDAGIVIIPMSQMEKLKLRESHCPG